MPHLQRPFQGSEADWLGADLFCVLCPSMQGDKEGSLMLKCSRERFLNKGRMLV
jgi:hypothetical protein